MKHLRKIIAILAVCLMTAVVFAKINDRTTSSKDGKALNPKPDKPLSGPTLEELKRVKPQVVSKVSVEASSSTLRPLIGSAVSSPAYIGLPLGPDVRGRMQATGHSEVDIVFTAATTSTLTEFGTEIISNGNYSSHSSAQYVQAPSNNCNGTTNNEDGSGVCGGAYSSGHGGTIQLDIYADDSGTHEPTGPSLGSFTWNQPMLSSADASNPNGRGFFTQAGNDQGTWQGGFPLTPAPSVTVGQRLHAIFTNPHVNANNHWYGINTMQMRGTRRRKASQDIINKFDFDVRFKGTATNNPNGIHNTLGVWRSCSKNEVYTGGSGTDCWGSSEQITSVPVFFAKYGNGESSGNGYEINIGQYWDPAHPSYAAWGGDAVNGTSSWRQTITLPGTTDITEIGAMIIPLPGAGSGTAVLNLRRTSDNSLIVGASIPYAEPPPLPGGRPEGANTVDIKAIVSATSVPAGQYYIEHLASSGSYWPVILYPFNVLTDTSWTNTGTTVTGGLPDWPAGSRYDGGRAEFRTSPGGAWNFGNPVDLMSYIATSTVSGPLDPLTVSITSPTIGASVPDTANVTADATTDVSCPISNVTFWINGVQSNVKTVSPYLSWPFNAPIGSGSGIGAKTSIAIGPGSHSTYAVASDGCGRTATSATRNFTITGVNPPPVFTSGATKNVNTGFTVSPVTATDTNLPIVFSLDSGTLPAGVTFNADGTFTGQVASVGTFVAVIRVTDSLGAFATQSLTINGIASTISVVSPTQGLCVTNPVTLVASYTGSASVDFSLDGGAFNQPATGGPPTHSRSVTLSFGSHVVAARANISLLPATSGNVTFTVAGTCGANPPPVFTSGTTRSVSVGAIPSPVTATDANQPITYQISAGAPPSGLTLGTNGVFTAPSIAGSFTFTVRATDSLGAFVTQNISMTVTAIPVTTTTTTTTTTPSSTTTTTVLPNTPTTKKCLRSPRSSLRPRPNRC